MASKGSTYNGLSPAEASEALGQPLLHTGAPERPPVNDPINDPTKPTWPDKKPARCS